MSDQGPYGGLDDADIPPVQPSGVIKASPYGWILVRDDGVTEHGEIRVRDDGALAWVRDADELDA